MMFDRFEGMDGEESQAKLDAILQSAFSPIKIGELNDDLETVTETFWPEDVVMKVRWQPGWASIWDNKRLSHSRTPLALYTDEDERRMWQLIRHHEKRDGIPSGELR